MVGGKTAAASSSQHWATLALLVTPLLALSLHLRLRLLDMSDFDVAAKPVSFAQGLVAVVTDREYWIRCAISLPVALSLYMSYAVPVARIFPRAIIARGSRPPTHGLRWDADMTMSIVGLIAGTPMIQLFHHASDKYGGATGMLLYKPPLQYGCVWAIAQIPIYLLLWDLTFYVLHRFILHAPGLYRTLHLGHHVYRASTTSDRTKPARCYVSALAKVPSSTPFDCPIPFMRPLWIARSLSLRRPSHRLVGHRGRPSGRDLRGHPAVRGAALLRLALPCE